MRITRSKLLKEVGEFLGAHLERVQVKWKIRTGLTKEEAAAELQAKYWELWKEFLRIQQEKGFINVYWENGETIVEFSFLPQKAVGELIKLLRKLEEDKNEN